MPAYPALYVIDLADGEATGEVLWFCCEECRQSYDQMDAAPEGCVFGEGDDAEFPEESICANCGVDL